jgi:hypothetical protein
LSIWTATAAKIRRATTLSRVEQRLLLSAWFRLFLVGLGLRMLRYPTVEHRLGGKVRQKESSRRSLPDLERVVFLVRVAARHHPFRAQCLERSICARWILARHGIASRVRIGALRRPGRLHAHAWLEHEGRALGEASELPPVLHASDEDSSKTCP